MAKKTEKETGEARTRTLDLQTLCFTQTTRPILAGLECSVPQKRQRQTLYQLSYPPYVILR